MIFAMKRKMSKSEILLKIMNTETRDMMLDHLSKSSKIPIPKAIFLNEELNPHRIGLECIKKKKQVCPDTKSTMEYELFVRTYLDKPKFAVEKALKDMKTFPENGCFETPFLQVFYYSLSLKKKYCQKTELKLLNQIQKMFLETKDKSFMKYCHYKFSKKAINSLLQSNICNFQEIKPFITFLTPKLQPEIIEVWFETNFEFIDSMFERMNTVSLSSTIPFNNRVFSHFLKFKSFRKAIFNTIDSKVFVIAMKNFANRDDFAYFYRKIQVSQSIEPLVARKPRDFLAFNFFSGLEQNDLLHSKLSKIKSYQSRIGHSFILHMFLLENLTVLTDTLQNHDLALEILQKTVEYNSKHIKLFETGTGNISQEEYQVFKDINKKLFIRLKRNEIAFKKLLSSFYNPPDQVLSNIISLRFSEVSIKDAIDQINFGYENELINYFKTKQPQEFLDFINSWNCEFFLKLFSEFSCDTDTAVLILNFIKNELYQHKKFQSRLSLIYSQLMTISSQRIFDALPENLRIIYVQKHKEFIPCFVKQKKKSIDWDAWLYELQCNTPNEINKISSYQKITAASFESVVETLFYNAFVLKNDSFCLFVNYFEQFVDQALITLSKEELLSLNNKKYNFQKYFYIQQNEIERIHLSFMDDVDFKFLEKMQFVLSFYLSNRYVSYALFEKFIELLSVGTSQQRILILSFIDSSLLVKKHILRFLDRVIPLLHNSNVTVCNLSKERIKQIKVESSEIQSIFPEIVRAFLDKESFLPFLTAFKAIQFNNYLCFNSLNIVVQILLRYLKEYPTESFEILKKIINIIKDRDIKYISGLLFAHMGKFVVKTGFHSSDALEIASQFCLYVKFDDFKLLLENMHSLKISNYLAKILQVKGDNALNDEIISFSLTKSGPVEPAFIAAACELNEFSKYLEDFLPEIENLFKNEKLENRQIATKAFKSVLENQQAAKYRTQVEDYLQECCIFSDHIIRLQCLDIVTNLAIIYVLRHDPHTVVKKKAYDIWKRLVSNANKELKILYKDILDLAKYQQSKTFCSSLKATLSEMLQKYPHYIESYIENDDNDKVVKEFIFIEAIKVNKLVRSAINYSKYNYCPDLLKCILQISSLRDEIIEDVDKETLFELCFDDNELAFYIFKKYQNPVYIEFLTTAQKIEIIKQYYQASKTGFIEDENVIFILQSIESCKEVENLLIRISPAFSYYYISIQRDDFGGLYRIFERVFNSYPDNRLDLDQLVLEKNIDFIKHCAFEHINDKERLLLLLQTLPDRKAFERIAELVKNTDIIVKLQQESFFIILGYLFRNLLSVNRKDVCIECVEHIYATRESDMGFFKEIAKSTILKL
ncbi:hypothetical protein GINT2_002016 [Glugoides intestinalis]